MFGKGTGGSTAPLATSAVHLEPLKRCHNEDREDEWAGNKEEGLDRLVRLSSSVLPPVHLPPINQLVSLGSYLIAE